MAVACSHAVKQFTELLTRCSRLTTCMVIPRSHLHTTTTTFDKFYNPEDDYKSFTDVKKAWSQFNDVVYAPTKEGEAPKPAEICHYRHLIPTSAKKFWYSAVLVRGLSIDEALKQCEFSKKASAKIVRDVLLEAQEMAIKDFNVEFKSNLWIADSFAENAMSHKIMRRHGRRRYGQISIRFCTYYVRLREGPPPEHYYAPEPSGNEKLDEYIRDQRQRRIINSL